MRLSGSDEAKNVDQTAAQPTWGIFASFFDALLQQLRHGQPGE
jgi:hypothetical protein